MFFFETKKINVQLAVPEAVPVTNEKTCNATRKPRREHETKL